MSRARAAPAADAVGRKPSVESDARGAGIWFHRSPTVRPNFPASVSLSVKWDDARCLGQGLALRACVRRGSWQDQKADPHLSKRPFLAGSEG